LTAKLTANVLGLWSAVGQKVLSDDCASVSLLVKGQVLLSQRFYPLVQKENSVVVRGALVFRTLAR
jgi:hypothetical protein